MRDAEILERELRAYITNQPADAGRFLHVIAQALTAYEKAQQIKRVNLADKALLCLLSAELVEREEYTVPLLFPAFVHQFARGLHPNQSTCEREAWGAFLRKAAVYLRNDANTRWLQNVHPEWWTWWETYATPPAGFSATSGAPG